MGWHGNGFITALILDEIFMNSNKVKLVDG